MGSEVGGLSTALGLFARPLSIVSTESVVVMEWKGMRTSIAHQPQHLPGGPPGLQSTCACPSTPSPRLIRSKLSTADLPRAPARCSIRPSHRSKMAVAVCSRNGASRGLFMTSPCRPDKPPEHTSRGFRTRSWPVELSRAPDSSCTAQPRARGSKFQLNPSSWAREVPVFHSCALHLALFGAELQSTCS